MRSSISLAERFAADVIPEPMSGCHLWIGTVDPGGYGIFHHGGRRHRAHRVAYELKYGTLPAGMMACHKCDNPPCVNHDHLFAGTASDNERDKVAKGRHALQKRTACTHGHPYTPQNTYIRGGKGWRACRTCRLAANIPCKRRARARTALAARRGA